MLNKNIKKLFASLLIGLILFVNSPSVYAFELPSIPTPPPAPTAPPVEYTLPPIPTPPPAPTAPPVVTPAPTQIATPKAVSLTPVSTPENTPPVSIVSSDPTGSPIPLNSESTGSESLDGGNGASITTGDANNSGLISTNANNNLANSGGNGQDSITIGNTGNGADSTNSGSISLVDNNNTNQTNSAFVVSDMNLLSDSGNNSADKNTGGDNTITTGDANVTGTILNSVNTNVAGVNIAEFNVLDDHTGDIILDFSGACPVSGCTTDNFNVVNSGNGASSTNNAEIDALTNNNTFQANDAVLENNMTLTAETGDNTADKNTGGDNNITTGDANVAANILNFANNNIAGNVVYGVVNIFGNLIGDIILPGGITIPCCSGGDINIANTRNGSNSTNTTDVNLTDNTDYNQFNSASISNNLIFDANSGNNDVSDNTGGNSSVTTGDTSITAQVMNIANANIIGGEWWLVLVNQAGRWIGQIVGANGLPFGGSDGLAFEVSDTGEITVTTSGNGANSTNNATVDQTTNNVITQNNNAEIVNNVNLTADSGNNSASKNTNGNSKIVTGDADIVANIVNFVNNNIIGAGRLFVTVVNVFGSWTGNFYGPGQEKIVNNTSDEESGIGGAPVTGNSSITGITSNTSSNTNTNNTTNLIPTIKPVFKVAGLTTRFNPFADEIVGEVEAASTQTDGKKTLNINLAWLLVILFPIGLSSIIYRRWAS